ncbi:MAG: zinc ribbon domain-containing protein [Chlorobiota bacterium]
MEESKSQMLALLAIIDRNLDELDEEFGDLPKKVEELNEIAEKNDKTVSETENILKEVKEFCNVSKNTLEDLKVKEEKLSEQQFQVRNNKEFDAITSEIKHVKEETKMLTEKLRQETIKEQNLDRILQEQKDELTKSKILLEEAKKEMDEVQGEQDDEKNEYLESREKLINKLDNETVEKYNRVREYHKDAAVRVRRNSCSGCFSSIPPQIIVEMRSDDDIVYTCENCARILIPEEIEVNESDLETI